MFGSHGGVAWHDEPQDQRIAAYGSREQMLAASRERPAVVEPPTEIVLREVVLARHQVSAHQINRSGESELPARPPSAERPAAFARRLAIADLESQLDMAARAFARWQGARDFQTLEQLAEGPEQTLNQTLGGIAATSDELRVAVIEAALGGDEPDVHRQQVAMFALLMRDEAHALGLVDARLGDPQLAPALRGALSLWRGPQTNAGLAKLHGDM